MNCENGLLPFFLLKIHSFDEECDFFHLFVDGGCFSQWYWRDGMISANIDIRCFVITSFPFFQNITAAVWTARCRFHQHFMRGFFVRKFCVKLFSAYILCLSIFLVQEYWRKCAHKMLVKLTIGLRAYLLLFLTEKQNLTYV